MCSTENISWNGRSDGEGAEHARWHQRVSLATASTSPNTPHLGLVGFESHEGVRRNKGRIGAAEAPHALRTALSGMALHGSLGTGEVRIVDWGNVTTEGEALEEAQAQMGQATAHALSAPGNVLTIVLGGGHETAWSSYLGLQDYLARGEQLIATGQGKQYEELRQQEKVIAPAHRRGETSSKLASGSRKPSWGVLNLDAHFDLRSAPTPTSGTPFLQMAEAERARGHALSYAVLGISAPSNTKVLFDTADELGVQYRTDLECFSMGTAGITRFVEDFAASVDVLYLTIDLDVLPAHTAPGVSAPAALGVDLPLITAAVQAAAGSGKLALMDVVELNPRFDIDQRTAKAAARLISEAAHIVAH